MLKIANRLIIPAMALVSATTIHAGTKFFTNFSDKELTISLTAGKEIVTTVVKPGETRVVDYKMDNADTINFKTPPEAGKMFAQDFTDGDGINTNTQFFFTRKGVKMSPRNPLDRMMVRIGKKKPFTPGGDKKEKADIAADDKVMQELEATAKSTR